MGEAKLRKERAKAFLPFVDNGLLCGAKGTQFENSTPEQLAEFCSRQPTWRELLKSLTNGQSVMLMNPRSVTPGNVMGNGSLASRVINAVSLCQHEFSTGCGILSMPYGDDTILEDDRNWFAAHPDRNFRIRPMITVERDVGTLRMGFSDRVIVVMINRDMGMRTRFFFGTILGHHDLNIDQNDQQIVDLILRRSRFSDLPPKTRESISFDELGALGGNAGML